MYLELLLRKVSNPDTAKVCLYFTEKKQILPSLEQLLGVAIAKWPFAFLEYDANEEHKKKQMILDSLHAAFVWVARQREWDINPFQESYDEILRRDLNYEGWSKKSWFAPNRKYKGKLGFSWGLRLIRFFVGVFDRKGREIGRKPLGEIEPEMAEAAFVLKRKATWDSRDVFRVQFDDNVGYPKKWEVNLSDLLAKE
jgi:hypothetical protein